jgi:hypothetical protein
MRKKGNRQLTNLAGWIWIANLTALALFAGIGLWFGVTWSVQADTPNNSLSTATLPALHTPRPSVTPVPPPTQRATITPWASPSPEASMTLPPRPASTSHPSAVDWREWPVVPEFSPKAKVILTSIKQDSDFDLHTFSKVGDCQMTANTFLGGYARGEYRIPAGFEATVAWYSKSMESESITSHKGLAINSVLSPLFGYAAGHKQCQPTEIPLACELRLNHPPIVLIAMGTNWSPGAEASFEKYLRQEVDMILASGALPILSTKGDNVEEDWKLNLAIATVAFDYDLPLVNVWKSMQDSPNRGLDSKDYIHLNYYGLMRRNEAWLGMLEQVRLALE